MAVCRATRKICFLKALANEDTLLQTHCCRHKCFPVCPRATFVADTNFVSGTQKMFPTLFRNILCPQQMFPSLRSSRNIMGNNVSSFTRAFTTTHGHLPSPSDKTLGTLGKTRRQRQRERHQTKGLRLVFTSDRVVIRSGVE